MQPHPGERSEVGKYQSESQRTAKDDAFFVSKTSRGEKTQQSIDESPLD